MTALSVVSTEVGRLSAQLEELRGRVAALTERTGAVEAGQSELDSLAAQLDALHGQVLALEDADRDRTPPPQPWDWVAMEEAERAEAIVQLRAWVGEVLAYWWPAAASRLPECWAAHPQLLQDVSLLHVSYQQAYEHPTRRVHHGVDFRHLLREVSESAQGLVTRSECERQHPHLLHRTAPARAAAGPARPPEERQQALERIADLMAYSHGVIDQSQLPADLQDVHRDRAYHRAQQLVAEYAVTDPEYQEVWTRRYSS